MNNANLMTSEEAEYLPPPTLVGNVDGAPSLT
jgi:hypothetical protein